MRTRRANVRTASLVAALLAVALVSSLLSATGAGAEADPAAEDAQLLEEFWLDSYGEPVDGGPTARAHDEGSLLDDPFTTDIPGEWSRQRLAKAEPDECYDGIGNPYPELVVDAGGVRCVDPVSGEPQGQPKTNAAYVWGLAEQSGALWFGTGPNIHCLVLGTFLGTSLPHETDSWVCEFGESQLSPPLPEFAGDWRPPDFYRYDLETRALSDVTPADPLAETTIGIRSAGAARGVVLMGGPALLGVNLFAFDARSGDYLGSKNLPQYSNIRRWVSAGGELYTGVGNLSGGGSVLRWTGDHDDPFSFEVVGDLDAEAAELAPHQGRLYVATWPQIFATTGGGSPVEASLWMSPPLGDGLDADDADGWSKVWTVSEYEPDPVTAATYGGGALQSFGGYLWWGTMHVPMTSALAHVTVHGVPETEAEIVAAFLGTHRAISVFRSKGFDRPDPTAEVVYGMAKLPAYSATDGWTIEPTGMGAPRWGLAGFGNLFNNYTWTMAVAEDLFIGTMDWGYLGAELLGTLLGSLGGAAADEATAPAAARHIQLPLLAYGADLMRVSSPDVPGRFETKAGAGNYTSYGIRTMLGQPDRLVLGMANPMNLLTDPTDTRPEGGWELVSLTPPDATPPAEATPQTVEVGGVDEAIYTAIADLTFYAMVDETGTVYTFPEDRHVGDAPIGPGARAVDIAINPDGTGYYVLDSTGAVFAIGDDTEHHGNLDTTALAPGEVPAAIAVTDTGEGYWVFTNLGGAHPFGDATDLGGVSNLALVGEIVDAAPYAPGFYMAGADGGVFTPPELLGSQEVPFFGSIHTALGSIPLAQPIVTIYADATDRVGYSLAAGDGGMFNFESEFCGSIPGILPGVTLNEPVVNAVPYGDCYVFFAADGGAFVFGDQPFLGSLGDDPPPHDIVSGDAFTT